MKTIFLIMTGFSLLFGGMTRDDAAQTVSDGATGLMWQDDANASTYRATWQGAIDYCEALTLGGYDDWRLPNINELKSIVDRSGVSPAMKEGFVNTGTGAYWSGTPHEGNRSYAWGVRFRSGNVYGHYKGDSYYVRCVQDIQELGGPGTGDAVGDTGGGGSTF